MITPANPQSINAQLDSVLAEYSLAIEPYDPDDYVVFGDEALHTLMTRCIAAVDRAAPRGTAYERRAEMVLNDDSNDSTKLKGLIGVLRAMRADYVGGFMQQVEELIHAGLFDDFLDMANELLAKGYKDAAAVIGGSVLEEHLRKLANRARVPTVDGGKPIKTDRLNADLLKASVYNLLEQKNMTAWLDLRNKAAHGEYAAYDDAHVNLTLQSIRSFVARHPA